MSNDIRTPGIQDCELRRLLPDDWASWLARQFCCCVDDKETFCGRL
jgi:hypothetical protein